MIINELQWQSMDIHWHPPTRRMFNHHMHNMLRFYHATYQFLKPCIYAENPIFVVLLKKIDKFMFFFFFANILPMNIVFGSTNHFLQCYNESCRLNLIAQFHPQPLFQTQANT